MYDAFAKFDRISHSDRIGDAAKQSKNRPQKKYIYIYICHILNKLAIIQCC